MTTACLMGCVWYRKSLRRVKKAGLSSPTSTRSLSGAGWLVACLFINEQLARNGTTDAIQKDGTTVKAAVYLGQYGGVVLYSASERLALANYIEGLAFERFGADKANYQIVKLYQHMAEADPLNGNLRLSQWGRESLAILHDGFIKKVSVECWPESPTAH